MINIYFGAKCLTISSGESVGYAIVFIPERPMSRDEILALLDYHSHLTISCDDEQECYDSIASQFTQVTAAGGVVCRGGDEYLMIHRNGRYDLPKGHWEIGETIEECAVREVEEETGVVGVTIGEKICETQHIYLMRGKWELKRTHWYRMTSESRAELKPQQEEGIESVGYVKREEIDRLTVGSYPTIRYVLAELFK